MNFSYSNSDLWQVTIDENDLKPFSSPCLGNGFVGVRTAPLIISPISENLFPVLSKQAYDGGRMLIVPSFHCIDFYAEGVLYSAENGSHKLKQTLDLRNGSITMRDEWTYAPEKCCTVYIKLFVSRAQKEIAYLSFSVEGAPEGSVVRFGIANSEELIRKLDSRDTFIKNFSSDTGILTGNYVTTYDGEEFCQQIGYKLENGNAHPAEITEQSVLVTADFSGELSLELWNWFAPSCENQSIRLKELMQDGADRLLSESQKSWIALWNKALAFADCGEVEAKNLLIYQFYLLSSSGACPGPLGALGLSSPGWLGCQLWDADLWIYRALLPLWRELAFPILEYRLEHLDEARRFARDNGYRGAWFPWMSDNRGRAMESADYREEIHINIWIALAASAYYHETQDKAFLKQQCLPLMSEIISFFRSWAEVGPDGKYHINNIIGPNEYVTEEEHRRADDNILTNFGLLTVLLEAQKLSLEAGETASAEWKDFSDKLFIPVPNEDGIIPEHALYKGEIIKQADTIMVFFPLNYNISKDVILKNVEYYHERISSRGPLMNCQIEAAIYMQLGLKEQGLKMLFERFEQNVRGKYRVPYETVEGDNSIMLTGIGGMLQALIFGYFGYKAGESDKIPRVEDFQL